jgi:hypothetical protein
LVFAFSLGLVSLAILERKVGNRIGESRELGLGMDTYPHQTILWYQPQLPRLIPLRHRTRSVDKAERLVRYRTNIANAGYDVVEAELADFVRGETFDFGGGDSEEPGS